MDIEVELVGDPNREDELGFIVRNVRGKPLKPQEVMDAVAEVLMTTFGEIPTPTFDRLNS